MTGPARLDTDPHLLAEQLSPARTALLQDAAVEAEQITAEATAAGATLATDAHVRAEAEIERARLRTEMTVRARADQELARARADAHREVLVTQEAIRQRLISETRRAALDLRGDPRYPKLIEQLARLGRHQLGEDAVIERDPEGLGGVVAVVGGRRVDYTLPALANRALNALADEVAQLWA